MNKVLVVTAGSRGIGAAISRRAAEHGFAVAINYRASEDAAQTLAEDIRRSGGEAAAFRLTPHRCLEQIEPCWN